MRAILFIILGIVAVAMIIVLEEAFVPKGYAQEVRHTSQGKQKHDAATLFKFSIDPYTQSRPSNNVIGKIFFHWL